MYMYVTQRPKQRNANDTFSIANHKYWCKQQKMQFNSNPRFASEWKTDREWMNKSRFLSDGRNPFLCGRHTCQTQEARHKSQQMPHEMQATIKYYTTQFCVWSAAHYFVFNINKTKINRKQVKARVQRTPVCSIDSDLYCRPHLYQSQSKKPS